MAYPTSSISTADFDALLAASARAAPVVPNTNTNTGFMVYLTRSLPDMTITVAGTNSIGSSSIFPVDLRKPPPYGCPVPNIGFGVGRAPWVTGSKLNVWTTGAGVLDVYPYNYYAPNMVISMNPSTISNTNSSGVPCYFMEFYNYSGRTQPQSLFISDILMSTATHLADNTLNMYRVDYRGFARLDDGRMMRIGGNDISGNFHPIHSELIDPHGTGTVVSGGQMRYRRRWTNGAATRVNSSNVVSMPGGKVMVIGGDALTGSGPYHYLNNPDVRVSGCEVWSSGVWTEVAPFSGLDPNGTIFNPAAFYIGNSTVVLYGGETGTYVYSYDDRSYQTYTYNTASNTWTHRAQVADTSTFMDPAYMEGTNFTVIPSGTNAGKLYMFGPQITTMLMDTSTFQWTLGPNMVTNGTYGHVVDSNGVIYCIGYGPMQYLDTRSDFTWKLVGSDPLTPFNMLPSLLPGDLIGCVSSYGTGSFWYGHTNTTGVAQLRPDVHSYRYSRGVPGNNLTFYGERLGNFGLIWNDDPNFYMGMSAYDISGTEARTQVPDPAMWSTGPWIGVPISLSLSSAFGSQQLTTYNFAMETTGAYDPTYLASGTYMFVTETFWDPANNPYPSINPGQAYSDRGVVIHSSTIIRLGGADGYWTGTSYLSWMTGTNEYGAHYKPLYQYEYLRNVQRWRSTGTVGEWADDMNTGCSSPAVVSWQNKIVVIGGATKREIFWSGTNAGPVSQSSLFEPMVYRAGVDPADRFHNVQVGTMASGPTGPISWSNGVPLNVPRISPTCVALKHGKNAGKILVAGGFGQSVLGYTLQSISSSAPLGKGIVYVLPATPTVEIGDPVSGWTLVSNMPSNMTWSNPIQTWYGGSYIKSGTTAEALAGANGVLPVTAVFGRAGMSAVELDDGRVFFTGGDQGSYWSISTGSSMLYDPDTDKWQEILHTFLNQSNTSFDNTTFGYKPAVNLMLDGRVFILANNVGGAYQLGDIAFIFDPASTGSDQWLTITTPTEIENDPSNRLAHVMENGNIALVNAGIHDFIYDQCNLQLHPFSQSLDWALIGGTSMYNGSGTFVVVGSDYVPGEGDTPKEVISRILYENVVPPTGTPPTPPYDASTLYRGMQLVSNSMVSASSRASTHNTLTWPYGPGQGDNVGMFSDWWKFVPTSSSNYYFWARSGTDFNFPTGSNDTANGFFDSRMWIWAWPTGTTPLVFNDDADIPTTGTGQPYWPSLLPLTGGDANYWSLAQQSMTSGTTYYIEVGNFVAWEYFRYKLGVGAVGFSGTVSGTLTHLSGNPP